jgi:hypothetical protein
VLLHQADRVGARLRRANLRAGAVVLYIKYDDFAQITRQTTLPDATSDGAVIARAALGLLAHVEIDDRKGRRVRLCGVAATSLDVRDAPRQLTLDERARARGERLGDVAVRFGYARFKTDILIAAVLVLVVMVQGIQFLGDRASKSVARRRFLI